jgi:hypothetical protein
LPQHEFFGRLAGIDAGVFENVQLNVAEAEVEKLRRVAGKVLKVN